MIYKGAPVYSVNQINLYIKSYLTNNEQLKHILVKGEISNLKIQDRVGHLYFSLKDKDSLISAIMFSSYAKNLNFPLENGKEVIVLAGIDAYPPRGTYQLIVTAMEPIGEGKALLELQKLKEKLLKEGLFDESRKRTINLYPNKIGVISAKNSAAIKDIIHNLQRRYPPVEIYFFPSLVQGEGAIEDLKRAFNLATQYPLDTLIIGRGGGASEDLSAFNDEGLARLVAASKIPVISAVGHEIDTTIIDLVADKRASTPTGASELATVDQREIMIKLFNFEEEAKSIIKNQISDLKENILFFKKELNGTIINIVSNYKNIINGKAELLKSLNPYKVLERGYSITTDINGKIKKDFKPGDKIKTILKNKTIISEIKEVEKK